jgi:hypothetical protein
MWATSELLRQLMRRLVDRKIPDQSETDERADQEIPEQAKIAQNASITY